MSLESAFRGDTYTTWVAGGSAPSIDWRSRRSMQTRNAASVLPEPVGAEIRVGLPARMLGQPNDWGSVGVPNLVVNHSAVTGCAQDRSTGQDSEAGKAMGDFSPFAFYLPNTFSRPAGRWIIAG